MHSRHLFLVALLFALVLVPLTRAAPADESRQIALRSQHLRLCDEIVRYWLSNPSARALPPALLEAYRWMLVEGENKGVVLERVPVRTDDLRTLAPALALARLEQLGLVYDQIYRLRLQPRE